MKLNRRAFLQSAVFAPIVIGCSSRKSNNIRVDEINFAYQDYNYRTPIKFGGNVLDRVTLLNVDCVVSDGAGKTAKGFGSMPM